MSDLDCTTCGTTNRPYLAECGRCDTPLQERTVADQRRAEWDALPAALREEFERDMTRVRRAHEDHRGWLRRYRWTHTVIAGALLALIVAAQSPALAVIGLAMGAAAGYRLNADRGGAMRGAGYTIAALLATILCAVPGGDIEVAQYFLAFGILSPFAFSLGYVLGMKMDWEHFEHSVTA